MRIAPPILIVMLALMTSCSSIPAVVQVGPDTYMISQEDHGGAFANLSEDKAAIIQQANEFAERQGKIAVEVSEHERPAAAFQWPAFDYKFRLADKPTSGTK